MANLLGDIWKDGEPDWTSTVAATNVKLHLYGKSEPRSGRKMGHITATADEAATAAKIVRSVRSRLIRTATLGV